MTRRTAAIALVALVLAPSASAGVRIGGVDTTGYPRVRVTVVAPTGSAQPQLDENGTPVSGLEAVNLGAAKSVVLAVDVSQSMVGAKLRAAVAAARAFVAAKGPNDGVEVVTFGSHAVPLTGFSTAGSDADAALRGLTIDSRQGTALWDAVVRGARALATQGRPGHVIVVVTDGQDVSSAATFEQAVSAAQHARAAVYAIGIAGRDFTPGPLRALAARTGGTFLEASSSAALTGLYRTIANTLAHTWQLDYVTAARPGQTVHVTARVPGVGTASRSVAVRGVGLVAPASPPAVLPRSVWTSSLAPIVLAGAVGALFLLAAWFYGTAHSGTRLRARLAPHLGQGEKQSKPRRRRQGRSVLHSLFAATERAFANVNQFRAAQQLLTRADVPLLASELLYICLGCAVGVGIVSAIAGLPLVLAMLFVLLAGAAPIVWIAVKARKRMRAFDNQLPDLLITVAATLKAGHSFRHAIQAVVDEGAEPTARELRRVLAETRLGRPMDEALAEMGDRVGSKNLSFVLNAVTRSRMSSTPSRMARPFCR